MPARPLLLAALALGFAAAACAPPGPQPLSDADMTAINNIPKQYQDASLAGDWAGITALYVDGGIRMPPHAPMETGKAAIEQALAATPGTTKSLTITPVMSAGHGDLAYSRGTFSIEVEMPGAPQTVKDTGKYLVVMKKQADGTWLISELIWNSDLPLPQMPPAIGQPQP